MARLHIFNKKQGRETEKSSNYTPYVLVGIAAILCYLNTLFGEFVYDDYEVIETNADVRWAYESIVYNFNLFLCL